MTKSSARKELAKIAISQVGVKEEGGNNCGKMIRKYQASTWLKPAPWPWCAAFVDWCVQEWLTDPAVVDLLGIESASEWRPKTAGAWDLARWAKLKQLPVLGEDSAAYAGDIVIFDFSHVGIIAQDSPAKEKTIVTIEGNTNGKGDRDSTSGDGVWKKNRARTLAKQFIRLV